MLYTINKIVSREENSSNGQGLRESVFGEN
jgi:hypothetical protein